jgi:tetratricopeptide (TPR) repeat protein
MPDSTRLKNMHQDIETERTLYIRLSDCRIGAARARFLVEKSALLQARAPLEAKDFLQDWQIRRERQELDQLAIQLRDCAIQALAEKRLPLAEETLNAAALIQTEDFISEERKLLELLKNPPSIVVEKPPAAKPPVKKPAVDTTLQKAGKARMALQSAMTRGDLRQAKTSLVELRELEGNSPQLEELNQSINDAIAAYIVETHEKANALYRAQQIVQARDLWKIILELDPNATQARVNLDRAERVLKKLEELQGTTTDVQPAAPTPTPVPTVTPGPIPKPTP